MIHNSALPLPAEVIPHRPPHLWLDGVIALVPGVSARGFWLPRQEHYDGHFEGLPLLPGVKEVESIAQLGAYALMAGSEQDVMGIFKGIESTAFEQPVKPGDTLELGIEIVDRGKRDFKGEGIAKVNGLVACRATITGILMPRRTALRLLGSSNT